MKYILSNHPKNNFDNVAFVYDFLAKLVFGSSIKKAQIHFLDRIPKGARVLIIGGGTGWIIPEIFAKANISELVYLDSSAKMIEMAKSKTPEKNRNQIQFIVGTEQEIEPLGQFDTLITFFFLDLFPEKQGFEICKTLDNSLAKDGIWLVCDFDSKAKKIWQQLLFKSMIYFFRSTCGIKSKRIPDIQQYFERLNFRKKEETFYYHNCIFSQLYEI